MTPPDLDPLLPALGAVARLIEASGRPGMIHGGIAVSLLGKPRFTADVDAVIDLPDEKLDAFLHSAEGLGLPPRIADPLAFARTRRVLLLRHESSGVGADVALALLPFELEALRRARHVTVGMFSFKIPTPEDLIVYKAVAHRPRDLEDIRGIVAQQSVLDVRSIRRWTEEFAQVLEMPELWRDVESLLH